MNDRVEERMPPEDAQGFVDRYRCATCWGHLIVRHAEEGREVIVSCAKPEDECSATGFVTANYVEFARSDNRADAAEAKRLLADAFGIKRKNNADILDDFGI